MAWGSLFLSAKGRIGRGDFWVAWFLLLIASAVRRTLGPAGALLSLLAAYPQVCLLAKRLHDVGKSGWFGLWIYGAAGVAAVAAEVNRVSEPLATVSVVSVIMAIVVFHRNALRRGEAGANAFGAPAVPILSQFGPRAA